MSVADEVTSVRAETPTASCNEDKPVKEVTRPPEIPANSAKEACVRNALLNENPIPPASKSKMSSALDSHNVFICSKCNQTFETSDLFQSHLLSHAKESPPLSSTLTCTLSQKIKEEVQTDTETSKRRKYHCPACSKIFCSKYNLDVHARIHSGERPYECSICGKTFGSSSNCKKHMKTHKAKGREEVKEVVDFMEYIKVHSGERPFECIVCAKRYTCKSDAQKHLRVHTGRRPYSCSFCSKTFSCSSNLYTHMRRKHKGMSSATCQDEPDRDGNTLISSDTMKQRCVEEGSRLEKARQVYSCRECGKAFDSRVQCEDHMKTHRTLLVPGKSLTGIFFCTMCEDSFLCFDNLMKHMMNHRRGHILTCTDCGEIFSTTDDFSAHRRHHCEDRWAPQHQHISALSLSRVQFNAEEHGADGNGETLYKKMTTHDSCILEPGEIDCKSQPLSVENSSSKQKSMIVDIVESEMNSNNNKQIEFRDLDKTGDLLPQDGDTVSPIEDLSVEDISDKESDSGKWQPRLFSKEERVCRKDSFGRFSSVVDRNVGGDVSEESETKFSTRLLSGKGEKSFVENCLPVIKQEKALEEEMLDMKGIYKCLFCNATFSSHNSLSEHAKLHTGDEVCQCTLCRSGYCCSSNVQLRGNKDGYLVDEGDTAYECFMCTITFDSRKPYIEHMRIHTKEKSFICYLCGNNFSQMKNLRQHFVGHTGERAFTCSECGKSFIRKVNLTNHMRIHSGDQPHKCSVCLKGYNSKYDLATHMRSHTGEKPCSCPDCGKSFASNGHLRKHMKIHSPEESQIRCSVCFKTFCDNTSLGRHFMIHTGESPFACNVCGKTFRRQIRLKYHMRIHTGDQPYKCSVCFKNYNSKYEMESHMRTHTGEKPFQCEQCDKSFQCKSSLNKHKQGHEACNNL